MRKPTGYAFVCSATGTQETDTYTCGHCNKVCFVKPMQRPEDYGGMCGCCTRHVCPSCVGKGCDVIEKKLERAEASYHARRSYGV